jgi:uncharacterized protein DUF4129
MEPIGRDEAQELARRELEKPIYRRDESSWLERAWTRFTEWINDLLRDAGNPQAQGNDRGWISIVIVIALVAVVIGLVLWLMRGRLNPRSAREPLLDEGVTRARDYRDAAEEHAAQQRWAEAIRERLRAIARDLEERVILQPRPGRTADELAAEAGAALPEYAERLHAAVRIFDDVWYGDRPGTPDGYATLRDLDEALRAAKPKPIGAPA